MHQYTSRRQSIVNALTEKLKEIGQNEFHITRNLESNVLPFLKFWDEVEEYPAIHLNAGGEYRIYQGGGLKDRFLTITIRVYIKDEENSVESLANLLQDVEFVVEENARLAYQDTISSDTLYTRQISVISITTDEGILDPLGVGEIVVEVEY